jgi:hypothetical protein
MMLKRLHPSRPDYTDNWDERIQDLVESRRWEIVGDILAILRSAAYPMVKHSRWGAWEHAVLSRLDNPDGLLAEITSRQEVVDDECDEAEIIREYFVAELLRRGHDPEADVISITAAQLAQMFNAASGRRLEVHTASKHMKTLHIPELTQRRTSSKNQWFWSRTSVPSCATQMPLMPSAEDRMRDILACSVKERVNRAMESDDMEAWQDVGNHSPNNNGQPCKSSPPAMLEYLTPDESHGLEASEAAKENLRRTAAEARRRGGASA